MEITSKRIGNTDKRGGGGVGVGGINGPRDRARVVNWQLNYNVSRN